MKLENIPFAPRRWPFPYCWFLLLVGTLGVIMSAPGQTVGVSAFIEPLMRDVLISRTRISLAYGVGTLLSAALLTFAGKMYDRIGARQSTLVASLGLGGTLIVLSNLDRIYSVMNPQQNGSIAKTLFGSVLIIGFSGCVFSGKVCCVCSRATWS